jgi:hypothetical protein
LANLKFYSKSGLDWHLPFGEGLAVPAGIVAKFPQLQTAQIRLI